MATAFKEINTKLCIKNMDKRPGSRQGFFFFFFYTAVFLCHFSPHTSQTHSFEALTCCKCSFSKRLQHISVRSRIAWILCMGTTQKSASGEHIAVCLNHHQRLRVTS